MSLSLNTNISALSAQRNLRMNNSAAASSIGKLSSGSRIVTAKDDAASLSIASGLSLDLASLRAANANIAQANSVLQIADGGYGQISEVLNRMKTLSATASSDQISDTERGFLNTEFNQLLQQVDGIASATSYNGVQLIGGGSTLAVDAASRGIDAANTDVLTQANGFSAFSFNPNIRSAGDFVDFAYDKDSDVMTATVYDASNGNIIASQSVDLKTLGGDPFDFVDDDGAGPLTPTESLTVNSTYDLSFDQIGVTVTLNEAFDTTADIVADPAANGDTEIEIIAGTTTAAQTLDFVTGVNAASDVIQMAFDGATVADLNINGTAVDSKANAQTASSAIDSAVNLLNSARSRVGAVLSRLEFAKNTVSVQIENTEAAKSTLMDVDVAEEFTKFSSKQVLIQAGVSILAQANQQPQALLRILQ